MPPKDYEKTTPTKLNPLLERAIDEYLQQLREDMIARAHKGDLDYQGRWLDLTLRELQGYAREEEFDLHVYRAMFKSRFKIDL